MPGAGGEPARSLAQFMRDEGLSLARTQVAVDYSYWPAHAVLQVRSCPAGGCRCAGLFVSVAGRLAVGGSVAGMPTLMFLRAGFPCFFAAPAAPRHGGALLL